MWQAKEASENGKQNDESDTVGEKIPCDTTPGERVTGARDRPWSVRRRRSLPHCGEAVRAEGKKSPC